MSARDDLRKGWCPGALRPMETGDGLLMRLRPRGGAFSLTELRAIASVAARHGSGAIDLTSRANFQLRGLTEESWRAALGELDAFGLIDRDAATESIRNIVVDPLFGLDAARVDLGGVARDLETRLMHDDELRALPSKFGFAVGDVADAPADIRIRTVDEERCAIALDGARERAAIVDLHDAASAAVRLARVFLAAHLADGAVRRMRDLVARSGVASVFADAALPSDLSGKAIYATYPPIGVVQSDQNVVAAVIGLPFGRLGADRLTALCDWPIVDRVRLSPGRRLVLPVAGSGVAEDCLRAAAALGLIADDADPRLWMDACPGAPSCRNATTSTHDDASRIAQAMSAAGLRAQIHVSGCSKGCARREPAALTLVASHGAYALVRDGSAHSTPAREALSPRELPAAALAALRGEAA